jgi:hypothetical protein
MLFPPDFTVDERAMGRFMLNSQSEMSDPYLNGPQRFNIGTLSAKCVEVNGYWLTTV